MQLSAATLSAQLFTAHNIRQLKKLASVYGVKNYGDMRKQELCDAIAAAKQPTVLPVLTVNSSDAGLCWASTPVNYGYFIRSYATPISAGDTRTHYAATRLLWTGIGTFPSLHTISDLIRPVAYGLLILTASDNTVLVFEATPADSVCAAYATPHSNVHKAQHYVYQRTQHTLETAESNALLNAGWSFIDTANAYTSQTVTKGRVELELVTDYTQHCNWVARFKDIERYLVLTDSEAAQLYGLYTPVPSSVANGYDQLMNQIHAALV